ncbi:hypothetical protein E4T56_gene18980 [Termitomyces sp. T112]|nr:hypothetical protein E4T56_gene18980 [Termitomyces sp. T112]
MRHQLDLDRCNAVPISPPSDMMTLVYWVLSLSLLLRGSYTPSPGALLPLRTTLSQFCIQVSFRPSFITWLFYPTGTPTYILPPTPTASLELHVTKVPLSFTIAALFAVICLTFGTVFIRLFQIQKIQIMGSSRSVDTSSLTQIMSSSSTHLSSRLRSRQCYLTNVSALRTRLRLLVSKILPSLEAATTVVICWAQALRLTTCYPVFRLLSLVYICPVPLCFRSSRRMSIADLVLNFHDFVSCLFSLARSRLVPFIPAFLAALCIVSTEDSVGYMISIFHRDCSSILLSATASAWQTYLAILCNSDACIHYLARCFTIPAVISFVYSVSPLGRALIVPFAPFPSLLTFVLLHSGFAAVTLHSYDIAMLRHQQIVTRRLFVYTDGAFDRGMCRRTRGIKASDNVLCLFIFGTMFVSGLILREELLSVIIGTAVLWTIRRICWCYLPSFKRRLEVHERLAEVVINPFLFIIGNVREEGNLEPALDDITRDRPLFPLMYKIVDLVDTSPWLPEGIG